MRAQPLHPALFKLMQLRARAAVRRFTSSLKTVRGAAITLFSLVMFGLAFGPSLVMALWSDADTLFGRQSARIESLAPLAVMVMSILTALTALGEKGISFSPPEIDFLFAAPFARRQLLMYRIVNSALGSFIAAIFTSLGFLLFVPSWPASFLGLLLLFQFINLLSINSALAGQVVSEHAYTLGRRLVLVVVIALAALGFAEAVSSVRGMNPWEILNQFQHSGTGRVLIAPFAIYSDMILAEGLTLAFWGRFALALAVNLLLFVIAVRMDANYLEAAARVSEKVHRQLEQMRRGGGFSVTSGSGKAQKRVLPRLPRLMGVGPLLRSQLIRGLRTSGRLLIFAGLMGAGVIGAPLLTQDHDATELLVWFVIGATGYFTILAGMMLPMGLRGDVDHMDWLKSLPLTSFTVAAGEVLGPALFFSLMHCAVFIPASLAVTPAWPLVIAAVCSLPINAVLFGIENLVFAWYPSRQMPTTPGDFQNFGLAMALMLLKWLILLAAAIPIAIVGTPLWLLGGPALALPAMWLTTAGVAIAIMYAVSLAFQRFDPSVDAPP